MDVKEMQARLGWTDKDRDNWLEVNAKYYDDPQTAWVDKLKMHLYPVRSAAVYVMPSYQSPITGKWIDTPAQRRDDMARNNARPWEGMEAEKKVATQRKAAEEKAADQAVENAVVSAYQALGSEKQQALESAL